MRYADKYENHFLNIECGRARFADFARFTSTALSQVGTPPALAALAESFAEMLKAFSADIVTRTTSGGSTQDDTEAENTQWTAIKTFINRTDTVSVQPAFVDDAKGLHAIYPAGLGGLTKATKGTRLTKLEAYVQALEAAEAALTKTPGKDARKLLEAYQALADAKDAGQNSVATLIQQLGPKAVALCEALWQVHCVALAVHYAAPHLAAAYFSYGLLPTRKQGPKKPGA